MYIYIYMYTFNVRFGNNRTVNVALDWIECCILEYWNAEY